MSSSFGKMLTVTIFGQSHGEAIGAVIDGLPAGIRLDFDEIERFMARRAPGGAFPPRGGKRTVPASFRGFAAE